MKPLVCLILFGLWFTACEEGNTPPDFPGYTLTVGDTIITIPPEAVEFIGSRDTPNHFAWHAYMLKEYQIATSPNIPRDGSAYQEELIDWKNQPWIIRRSFLIQPFTHDITPSEPALYYYLIGTYPDQFGFGWVDTFDPDVDLWNPNSRPWSNPADSTLRPDNPATIGFDGDLSDMLEYRAMWRME